MGYILDEQLKYCLFFIRILMDTFLKSGSESSSFSGCFDGLLFICGSGRSLTWNLDSYCHLNLLTCI